MIKVLVVDDSPVAQALLIHILSSDPDIKVISVANNGEEALDYTRTHQPDVITMDIHMPKMNGFEATRKIMETHPVPIIILSASVDPVDVKHTFLAIEAGAVAVLEKPPGTCHPDFENMARVLLQTVKSMSEVKVVRRWARLRTTGFAVTHPNPQVAVKNKTMPIKCVAIGASTGGPPALQTILSGLDRNFPAPILVVQHITKGFLQGMVDWLNSSTSLTVSIAAQGTYPLPGHVYFAPDDFHMGVEKNGHIFLGKEKPEWGLRPAVSYLFRSVVKAFGPNAAGVLLSGMGKDGAIELKLMKENGALTIAQDKASSVVHGMPGQAIKIGAASYVLPPDDIAATLLRLAKKS
jgi:two-component system chemotaxis response regulator CheB